MTKGDPDKRDVLKRVAERTNLREGPEGVGDFLRAVKRLGPSSLNQIARQCHLPIPVATAVRRELEGIGLLERRGGVSLTAEGAKYVEDHLGIVNKIDIVCPTCQGSGITVQSEMLSAFGQLLQGAPPVDVTLDQAPCTPETALKRAALMYERGALEQKEILILGDDDSVSLAICLFANSLVGRSLAKRITVLELDAKRSEFLAAVARDRGYPIEVISHDLRDPLPAALQKAFDVIETDPPYTLPGVGLFLKRGREGLRDEAGSKGYLSYAQRSGQDQFNFCQVVAENSFATIAIHRDFNAYLGASILGSVSQFLELGAVGRVEAVGPKYDGPLYTADINPRERRYRCQSCSLTMELGRRDVPETIEQLKAAGCPRCGGNRFVRLSRST